MLSLALRKLRGQFSANLRRKTWWISSSYGHPCIFLVSFLINFQRTSSNAKKKHGNDSKKIATLRILANTRLFPRARSSKDIFRSIRGKLSIRNCEMRFHSTYPFLSPICSIRTNCANRFIIDQSGLSTPYRNLKNIYLIFYNRIFESTYPSFFPPQDIGSENRNRNSFQSLKVTKFSNRSQRSQIINYTSERNSNHRWARSDVYDRERGNPAACKPREPALSRAYKRETLSTGGFSNSYSCEADRCVFHSLRFQRREPPTSFAPGTELRFFRFPFALDRRRDTCTYVGHACAFSTRIVKPSEVARDTYEGVRQRTEAYRWSEQIHLG